MVLSTLKWLGLQLLIGIGVLVLALAVTLLFQGWSVAAALADSAVIRFNGIVVWALGWGLVSVITACGRQPYAELLNIVRLPEANAKRFAIISSMAASHRAAMRLTVPATVLGGAILGSFGYPHTGVARASLALCSISIYYAASYSLYQFLLFLRAAHLLATTTPHCRIRTSASPAHLENLNEYLSVTTILGVCAIYAGFRGTLTADFLHPFPELRSLLGLPLILFLPATIVYYFYPRYVIARLHRHKMYWLFQRVTQRLEAHRKDRQLALERLLFELRETLFASDARVTSFLRGTDLVTTVVWLAAMIHTLAKYDPSILGYLDRVLAQIPQ